MRKPVGVTTTASGYPLVVCDDGSVWSYDANGNWENMKPIPGSASDEENSGRVFIEAASERSETARIVDQQF